MIQSSTAVREKASPLVRRREGRASVRIVLPAYNEERGLAELLSSIRSVMEDASLSYEIIVVDDGSDDGTPLAAEQAASEIPLRLVQHRQNQGLARALETGFRVALEDAAGDDVIVTMDADNTHSPRLIPEMLELIQRGRDVVVASRFPDGAVMVGVPRLRRAIGWAGSLLLQALFPIQGLREYTCGFRAYRACVLQRAFGRYGDGFISESGFTCMVDILLKLRLDSLLMGEVPLVLRYDRKSSKSKMRVSETIRQTLWLAVRRRFGWT